MSVRSSANTTAPPFLTRPVGPLFLSTVLPMTVVMSTGGLLTVIDGIFVGRLVGPEALAAVSLGFPVVMLLTALTALTGGGMASLMARHLGAGARGAAAGTLAGAQGLALALSAALLAAALLFGGPVVRLLAGGGGPVADMAGQYLLILVLGAPLQFGLGVQADALRTAGRAGTIAGLSILVNLLNVAANAVLIGGLGLGVPGSALGTVAAQALGLGLLVALRLRSPDLLPLPRPRGAGWREIGALGLPMALSFLGMAWVATTVLLALDTGRADHATQVAAYGAVTRLLTLAFLPQMAIALSTQTLSGHNAGAGRMDRVSAVLRLAQASAALWCLAVAVACWAAGPQIGALFSSDPDVVAAVAAILMPLTALYVFGGPSLVLALQRQALGYPGQTAMLTLVKPWLLTPVLIWTLTTFAGAERLWLAFPAADALVLLLAAGLLTSGRIGGPALRPLAKEAP